MDFAEALLLTKLGRPELAGWWGKLLGGGEGGGGEYGVEWDYSNPSPALTRTGDAARFSAPVPATSLTATGSSPFDRVMPWAGMRMCNIVNGEVAYWQDDPQFSETDHDTMVYIPEFWYKAEKDAANSKWRWSISPTEREGYARHPGSGRYIGRYHTSGSSAGVFSRSGALPLVATSRPNFRAYSHSKGSNWWMLDIATWSAVQLLYLVEFANFDSQDKLGTGQVGSGLTLNGGTDGAKYHTLKVSGDGNQYRWIEDPFSNVRNWIDGFLSVEKRAYIGLNNPAFSDSSSSLSNTNLTIASSGFISGFGYSSVCPYAFIPDGVSGSNSTYVTDNSYAAAGSRALFSGGVYTDTNGASGFFYFNAGLEATTENARLGSRLIYIP